MALEDSNNSNTIFNNPQHYPSYVIVCQTDSVHDRWDHKQEIYKQQYL